MPFRIVLRMRSSLDENFYNRRAVPGVRVDAEVLQGECGGRAGRALSKDCSFLSRNFIRLAAAQARAVVDVAAWRCGLEVSGPPAPLLASRNGIHPAIAHMLALRSPTPTLTNLTPPHPLADAGLTPAAPITITSLRFRDTGRLLAAKPRTAQLGAPELTMGKAPLDLVSRLLREGSAVYYSLAPASPSTREDLTIAACSRRLELRVVVFVDGIAQWCVRGAGSRV